MTTKAKLLALLLVIACASVWAGDLPKNTAGSTPMDAMKTAMMKCAVCKDVAIHMDEIGPMGVEAVQLNDGVVIRHWVKSDDPKKTAVFHAACNAASQVGQATMNWTDQQAKTDLCGFCQGIRSAMKAGAHMSQGETKNGDVMVITSADAAIQGHLSELQKQCAMMAASMEAPKGTTSASKE